MYLHGFLSDLTKAIHESSSRFFIELLEMRISNSMLIEIKRILDQFDQHICLLDGEGKILLVNQSWTKFAVENGSTLVSFEGRNYLELSGQEDREVKKFITGIKKVLAGERATAEVEYPCHSPSQKRWFMATARPVNLAGNRIALITHENETARVTYQKEVQVLLEISDIIYHADNFSEALVKVLELFCGTAQWVLGEIWFPQDDSPFLKYSGSCYCQKQDLRAFCDAAETLKFRKGTGLPGIVWETGEPHWIDDLSRDKNFLRSEVAQGINSALGVPVIFDDRLHAIIAFYHIGSQERDEHLINMMLGVAKHLGLLFSQLSLKKDLVRQKDFLHSIVNDQTDMIVRWKNDGELTFVNAAFHQTFGKTGQELLEKNFYQLIPEEELPAVKDRIKKLSPNNPVSSGYRKVLLPEGTPAWQHWTNRAFFDEDGNVIDYQSVGRDVTEKLKLEKKLESEKQRLFKIFQEAPVSMAIAKGEEHIFEAANQEYYKLTSRSPDIIGKSVREVFPELEDHGYLDWLNNVYETGETFTGKETLFYFYPEDSNELEERYLNFVYQAYRNEEGEIEGILYTGVDVTEQVLARKKIEKALHEVQNLKNQILQENIYLKEEIKHSHDFESMVFVSNEFREVLNQVENVAKTSATVLITGETGTGKELIARAIHETSPRKNKPMIKVNMAAIPRDLIESELFGHEKGAFTGATVSKPGKFELADNGTIFLDEIGEMPVELQGKLLRVLQEGEIERLGGTKTKKIDVRVIAATNRDLNQAIKQNEFREDLFFRLNVFPISLPPLRIRPNDIPILVEHFVSKYSLKHSKPISSIPKNVMNYLMSYEWPGNVRELENMVERAVILSRGQRLTIPVRNILFDQDEAWAMGDSLDEIVEQHIRSVLIKCNWKIEGAGGAAEKLQIKPSTLRDKMKKFSISRPE